MKSWGSQNLLKNLTKLKVKKRSTQHPFPGKYPTRLFWVTKIDGKWEHYFGKPTKQAQLRFRNVVNRHTAWMRGYLAAAVLDKEGPLALRWWSPQTFHGWTSTCPAYDKYYVYADHNHRFTQFNITHAQKLGKKNLVYGREDIVPSIWEQREYQNHYYALFGE